MSGLYLSGWHAPGVRRAWDRCAMDVESSGRVLRDSGVLALWGDPLESVARFAGDRLRTLAADYANGCRVILRRSARHFTLTFLRGARQ